jgi:hypothetical protein
VIIRELLTSLGIDFDTKGADAAEKRIAGLKGALETVGTVLTFGGVFAGLKGLANYASDAEQTMSKLRLNFEDNTQSVLDWADATADATGESKYLLREMAGTFGSMLVPTMDFDRKKAAEMSTTLTGLAEDLAAINNEKPEETMGRLFSGMTGSSEAVERLGINIKALALEEFARTQGIAKSVKSMNVREKAELIYAKILADTRDKVGAAAKESDSYAGSMLRLGAAWRDGATTLGQKLLPHATDFVRLLTRGLGVLGEWATDTNKVSSAFAVLGGLLAAMGTRFLVANLPLLGFALGLALITVAVNDLLTAFMDPKAKTAIGTFMDMLIGDKNWDRLAALPSKLGDVMFEMGLTDKQKQQRGITEETGTGIMDFFSAMIGEDHDAKAFNERRNRYLSVKRAAESGRQTARDVDEAANGGLFYDLLVEPAWKRQLNQTVSPYLQQQPRQQFGFDGAVNMTVNIAGNADSQTVREMKEATRQLLIEERRNLLGTTRTPAGFESNSVADEAHIMSGAGGVP